MPRGKRKAKLQTTPPIAQTKPAEEAHEKELARLRHVVREADRTETGGQFALEKRALAAEARADRLLALLEKMIEVVHEAVKRGAKLPSWLLAVGVAGVAGLASILLATPGLL